ncbi:MAG: methionyl-tRNA formyltransferase [Bradymonadaceae bacterium]|nr:methionyl-tRNA formyltransferase [Lujinxingiaceae bacterium]
MADSAPLRIVYMGTPDFAVPALQALIASRHEVVGVVTNPDRPSGRGKRLAPPPVKVVAEQAGLEVYQPERLRDDEAYAHIAAWRPDVMVIAAYGQILRQRMLDLPRHGCINIHASLLPGYRGAAPINWCIVRGEAQSGITIMEMERGLDTGPMLARRAVAIAIDQSSQELHDVLAALGAEMIVEVIEGLSRGELVAEAQDDSLSSYAPMLTKEVGLIDWQKPAREVHDHIRGFNPWPGAYAFFGPAAAGERIKFHRSRPVEGRGVPGEVLEADASRGRLVIACGQGAIEAIELQAPGKKAMKAADFLRGFTIAVGSRFVGRASDDHI